MNFQCKGTAIYAHAQKYMLQKILRSLHCNKNDIFCNIYAISKRSSLPTDIGSNVILSVWLVRWGGSRNNPCNIW